jgi:phosphorylcholine metabolism protein LicD
MIRPFNDFSYDSYGNYENFANGITIDRNIRETALKNAIEILNNNKIEYFVCYGSLLGIIREGRLLEFDDDIDILVHENDYERAYNLINNKYTLIRTDPDFCQGYIHEGKIELYKYIKDATKIIDKWTTRGKLQGTFDKDMIYPIRNTYVSTLKIYVNVPNKPEKVLEKLYSNWRVPTRDKGYRD